MSTGHPARSGSPQDRLLRTGLRLAPFGLLGLSLFISLVIGIPGEARLPQLVGLTAITAGYRLWWPDRFGSAWARTAGFVLNLALTFGLITLSPVYGVYAFIGYLDAVAVFSGAALAPGLVAAASLNALAQSGGPAHALAQPLLFGFLLLANGGLAVGMVQIDRNRQRTVSRLKQALADLEQAQQVNAELQDQLIEQARASGVLEERQRLSREIHDTVAQDLVAVLRQIEAANEAPTIEAAGVHLDLADRTARDALAEARRAVRALASPLLDSAGLPDALQALATSWSHRVGVPARLSVTGPVTGTPHDADLLRISQESLSNVTRHARASSVQISLDYAPHQVTLQVRDDGVGFEPELVDDGHGLAGMRARLSAIGGRLELDSAPGDGCTVRAVIPR